MGFGKPLRIFLEELRESSGTVSYRSLDPSKSSMGGATEIAYAQAVRPAMNKCSAVRAFVIRFLMHEKGPSTAPTSGKACKRVAMLEPLTW